MWNGFECFIGKVKSICWLPRIKLNIPAEAGKSSCRSNTWEVLSQWAEQYWNTVIKKLQYHNTGWEIWSGGKRGLVRWWLYHRSCLKIHIFFPAFPFNISIIHPDPSISSASPSISSASKCSPPKKNRSGLFLIQNRWMCFPYLSSSLHWTPRPR